MLAVKERNEDKEGREESNMLSRYPSGTAEMIFRQV